MGYVMNWRRKDADPVAAERAATAAWEAAVEARNALPDEERGDVDIDAFMAALDAEGPYEAPEDTPDPEDSRFWVGRSQRYIEAQQTVAEAYQATLTPRHGYFQLSPHAMMRMTMLMALTDMVYKAPRPDFPQCGDYGLTNDQIMWACKPGQFPAEHAALDDDTLARVDDYAAEHERVRAWRDPNTPGIPQHKFLTNDHWIVTPDECAAAVKLWQGHVDRLGSARALQIAGNVIAGDWWPDWIAFLEGAITHDGFEVS